MVVPTRLPRLVHPVVDVRSLPHLARRESFVIQRYRVRRHGRQWCVYDFGGFFVGWARSFEEAHALVDAHISIVEGCEVIEQFSEYWHTTPKAMRGSETP